MHNKRKQSNFLFIPPTIHPITALSKPPPFLNLHITTTPTTSTPTYFSGISHLFTPHHHLLTLAPSPRPRNLARLFHALHPTIPKLNTMPCTSGNTT